MADSAHPAPLDGVRVVDLSRVLAGPYCTMVLADLGADVIKLERPDGGDETRSWGPPFAGGEAAYYLSVNRGKRSCALDLEDPEARSLALELCARADVVVENFKLGGAERLGVGYEQVRELNAKVVYCSITGYGQDGPYRLLVGHDVNYASMAGALAITGPADGPPSIPANLLGDYAGGGMHAAIGILTALLARVRTGRGQFVDISMTDGIVNLLAAALGESYGSGEFVRRGRHRLTGGLPQYNVYECADGRYLSIGANEPWFFDNFCNAIDRSDLAGSQADPSRRQEVFDAFRDAIKTKSRDDWFEQLKDKDVCVAPVYELDEIERDPQLRAREMIVDLPHPEFGTVTQVGISVKLSETPGSIRSFAPRRGEHTDDVLREAGLSDGDIAALRAAGGTS